MDTLFTENIPGYAEKSDREKQRLISGGWYDGENKVIAVQGDIRKLSKKARIHIKEVDKYCYGG